MRGRNRSQPVANAGRLKTADQAKTFAVGCDQLPRAAHGNCVPSSRAAFERHLLETGRRGRVPDRRLPGRARARREIGCRTTVQLITDSDGIDANRRFAGDQINAAVLYLEDEPFDLDSDLAVDHWEVTTTVGRAATLCVESACGEGAAAHR